MKLSRNGALRINFRYSSPKENMLGNFLRYLREKHPRLVRQIKKTGVRNFIQPHLSLSCNFYCSYCLVSGIRRHAFSESHFHQTKLIWDDLSGMEDRLMVRINFDGETLADEWAMRCALYVNQVPNVSICELFTNNSIDPRTYVERFQPDKTAFNCSYHPGHMSLEKFLEHIDLLQHAGYRVMANLVVTPDLIKDLPVIHQTFTDKGILFRPNLLFGFYNRQLFPDGYTPQELACIRAHYCSEFEFEYALGKSPEGLDCYAGVDMLGIYLDGTVKRCDLFEIGQVRDIVRGKVKLRPDPYPCPHDDCPNYCHMMGLKVFRERFRMSDEFVDHYTPKE